MLISEALQGKFHRSYQSGREGIIQFAELRKDINTKEGVFAYACLVRPPYEYGKISGQDFYTTVYVAIDND